MRLAHGGEPPGQLLPGLNERHFDPTVRRPSYASRDHNRNAQQHQVDSERLRRVQALGVALAFSGVLLALLDGFLHARQSLFGDLCGVLAGALWASTTVLIRASRMSSIAPAKTLFYQEPSRR